MARLKRLSAFGMTLILAMFGVASAQSGDPLLAIQQKLRSQVTLTRTTAERSDIVTAGSVVELQIDGLMMYGVASPLPPSNTYKNGKISQGWGGFGKDLLITMGAPADGSASAYPHRKFAAGEKCWVTAITVQKDGMLFQLFSDPYAAGRYYANLKIPFPKGPLPPADAVLQIVAQVLTAQPSGEQGAQAVEVVEPPAPGPLHAVSPNRVAPQAMFPHPPPAYRPSESASPAEAPLPAIAPPPPPADALPLAPQTISIGQTQDEVTTLFGQPARVAKLGPTEIFFYKDMKVTFTNGKVSNID